MKSGNLNLLEPSGPPQVCNGTALPLLSFSLDYNYKISIPFTLPTKILYRLLIFGLITPVLTEIATET